MKKESEISYKFMANFASIAPAIASAIVTGILLIFSNYYIQKWSYENEIKLRNYEGRQKVYSELMGIKLYRNQLLSNEYQGNILLSYHTYRWKMLSWNKGVIENEKQKDSVDYAQMVYLQKSNNDNILEIARTDKRLMELLGLIKVYFPFSSELNEKINLIYNFHYLPSPPKPKDGMSLIQLDEWKAQEMEIGNALRKELLTKPLEELILYISKYITDEIGRTK